MQVETYAIKLCKQEEPQEVLSVCWNCKSVYRAVFFDSEELKAIYQCEYIGMEEDVSEEIAYHDSAFLSESSARTLAFVKDIERTYVVSIRDIFDIGGRDGFRMKELAEEGYSCKVFDPIPCEACSPLIAKEYVPCSGIKEGEKADLIILGSMLEHCENPHEIIESCRFHLREDGFIFVDIPYDISIFFEWLAWRRWLGKHLGIDFTHNVFYSRRTIQHLLEQHGLIVLSSKFSSIPAHKGSVAMMTLGRKVGSGCDMSKYKKWRSLDFDLLILRYGLSVLYRIGRRVSSLLRRLLSTE